MGATKNVGMETTRDEFHGTPEHDKLMKFIAKKENYMALANGHIKNIKEVSELRNISFSFELEKPIYQDNKFLVGVADAVITIKYESYDKKTRKWVPAILSQLIEIKPKITNLGEVIRQINLYRKAINNNIQKELYGKTLSEKLIFVETYLFLSKENYPDSNTRTLLREQKIWVTSEEEILFEKMLQQA